MAQIDCHGRIKKTHTSVGLSSVSERDGDRVGSNDPDIGLEFNTGSTDEMNTVQVSKVRYGTLTTCWVCS